MLDHPTKKALYNFCDPDQPLDPGDTRNVELPRGAPWIEELLESVTLTDGERTACKLFSGLRGSGKTTELRRFVEKIRHSLGSNSFVVTLVDVDDKLDLYAPLDITDLLLLMLAGAEREVLILEQKNPARVLDRPGAFMRVWEWLKNTEADIQKWEFGAKVPLGGGAELAAKVTGEFKTETPLRKAMREVMASRPTVFLEEIREAFKGLQERVQHLGCQGLVVVVDSIEHLQGVSGNWKDVIEGAERIFSSSVIELPVHVLYTVPPSVSLRLARPVTFIPMVKLHARGSRDPYPPGVRAMRELITHRIPMQHLTSMFGRDAVEGRLQIIIEKSGGYPRAMVTLLQSLLLRAKVGVEPAISNDDFEQVLAHAGEQLRELVRHEGQAAIDLLRHVATQHTLQTDDDNQRLLASRLLDYNILLRYKNLNNWWDVHPWVREMGELKTALKTTP